MAETITNGITKRMVVIDYEEDLKLSRRFLHSPPADGRCMCCGKHPNELKPFSGIAHASGMDVEEVMLVNNVRPTALVTKEIEDILEGFVDDRLSVEHQEKAEERLVELLCKEIVDDLLVYYNTTYFSMNSWECLECKDLDDEAYRAILASRNSQDHGDCIH